MTFREGRGYSHLNEEALNRTIWRERFGGGIGPVIRQTAERLNDLPKDYVRRINPYSADNETN